MKEMLIIKNQNKINKECLALLRVILLNSRESINRAGEWVNIFIPMKNENKTKTLHISLSLDRYWDILQYLAMEVTK